MRHELRCGFHMCVTMQRSRANMVWYEVRDNPVKAALHSKVESWSDSFNSDVCICDNNWDSSTAAPADPYDLLWVKKWAAIGDS